MRTLLREDSVTKKKPRIGRPPKRKADRYTTPVRILGRVDDETWSALQAKAEAKGLTFTAWAVAALRRAK